MKTTVCLLLLDRWVKEEEKGDQAERGCAALAHLLTVLLVTKEFMCSMLVKYN